MSAAQEQPEAPTVRNRLLGIGVSSVRLALHHEARRVLLDGAIVGDSDAPAPPGDAADVRRILTELDHSGANHLDAWAVPTRRSTITRG
ncbi:hypothetical protein LWC33_28260 [Pseudonocardia sp. RS11V-5]|uniref:hypothetical protein n=1 Tax=Pseudonocardia terrae TaxID=2905831 RepID=UPI001E49BB92|nr:hypothetical protein [Pseudonocardia terrae]MCE3555333.1 hypothetical protein [Pseudonocardia terrae]